MLKEFGLFAPVEPVQENAAGGIAPTVAAAAGMADVNALEGLAPGQDVAVNGVAPRFQKDSVVRNDP